MARDAVLYALLQTALNKANPSGLPSNIVLQSFAMPTDTLTLNTVVETIQTQLGYSYGWSERVAAYHDLILADHPVAYYRLDEASGTTAYDSSGNGYNGTIQGGVTLNQPGALFDGDAAMAFNGSTGYISTELLAPFSALTVETWINPAAFTGNNPRFVANGHTDTTSNGFELMTGAVGTTGSAGANVAFVVGNGSSSAAANGSQTLSPGTWYYLVGTYDGSTVAVYVNGMLLTKATANLGALTAHHGVAIGYNPSYSGDHFDGREAHAAIYDYALTAEQVLAHYNAGKGLFSLAEPYGAAWLLKLHAQIPPGASVSLAAAVGNGGTTPIPLVDPASTLVAGDTFRWQPATALGVVGIGPWGTPSAWPDPAATWLGPTADATGNVPVGQWLLKKWVFSPSQQTVTIYGAADNIETVFVGGQQVLQTTSFSTTTQATALLDAGWNLVSVSCLNTGNAPKPTGILLSIQDSQGTVLENGSTDARVGCTWETTGFLNTAWTTVTSASDLVEHWGVIPASALTSEDVTLTVTATANSSGDTPLIHGVDWITVAPWRWDAGGQYDATANTTPPATTAPRVVTQTVE